METLEKPVFAPTHRLHGKLVMKNPEFAGKGFGNKERFWVDEMGAFHRTGVGHKAELLEDDQLPAVTKIEKGGEFGETFGRIGEIIPTEWYLAHYAQEHSNKGVMLTREAFGAAMRCATYPDSDSPCGSAGNSKDDDATFEGKDRDGNCIVRLFMRGSGYFLVKIPRTMFLEVMNE
jgi:hypothetical protein